MYTFKNLCYGVDFNKLKTIDDIQELSFLISDILYGINIKTNLKKIKFEASHWYHGSSGTDYITGCIGFQLECNESKDYLNFVRTFNEEEYEKEYNLALEKYLKMVDERIQKVAIDLGKVELSEQLKKLKIVLQKKSLTLHEVEASS